MNGRPSLGRRSCATLPAATLISLVVAASSATAANYYVSPSGSDSSSCSSTAPCRQIRRALTLIGPGDTILVADGSYLGFDVRELDGIAGSPITIRAQGAGARVVPTTDRSDNRDTILVTYSSYIVIDGLRSYGATRAAVRVDQSPKVTIRNGVFGNNTTWGIFIDFSDDPLIEGNECYGSVQEHGIYISNSGDRPVVRANRVHDNAASGIQLNADASMGGDGLISAAVIENNIIYANGALGAAAINLDGVQNSIVRNNVLYANRATGIVNYRGDGAQGPKGMKILNNTVDQPSIGRYALLFGNTAGTNLVRNNILYHASTSRGSINYITPADVLNVDSDYNLITRVTPDDGGSLLTLALWQAQGHELHSITAAPSTLFASAAAFNYRLASASTAIDRGQARVEVPSDIAGRARPVGVGWDLGAYEAGVPSGAQLVAWTSLVGVTATGNSLTKTAATSWGNAGAVSTQQIASGAGYVEFTASETTTSRMLGLSNGNSTASYQDIDFAVYLSQGQLKIFEAGTSKGVFGTYAAGDALRVAVVGGVVKYSRNGMLVYTSTKTPVYPLLVDTALYTQGATLKGALIGSGAPVVWTSVVGATTIGNSLTKTAATSWGNAGAVSSQQIASGNGHVEFTASETTTSRMLGLSNGNSNASYQDIDFAVYLSQGQLKVFEAGTAKGVFGTYSAGEKLRVAVVGGVVKYSKNGVVFYSSSRTPVYPLLVDAALYTTGATIYSAVVSGAP